MIQSRRRYTTSTNTNTPTITSSALRSCHRVECPGCAAILDDVTLLPAHISEGRCPVFKSLPSSVLSSQQSSNNKCSSSSRSKPANHRPTPPPQQLKVRDVNEQQQPRKHTSLCGGCAHGDNDDDDDAQPRCADDSLLILSSQYHHHAHPADTTSPSSSSSLLLECDMCSTRGRVCPDAPARSEVRRLSSGGCNHCLCNSCIRDMFRSATTLCSTDPLKCPVLSCGGGSQVTESDTVGLISSVAWEQLHSAILRRFVDDQVAAGVFLRCPNCSFVAEQVPTDDLYVASPERKRGCCSRDGGDVERYGGAAAPAARCDGAPSPSSNQHHDRGGGNGDDSKRGRAMMSAEGVALSGEPACHYRRHRIRCTRCSTTFCSSCLTTPYHVGFTCEHFQKREEGAVCRFCQEVVTVVGSDGGSNGHHQQQQRLPPDVCRSRPECVERGLQCCPAVLSCRHPCYFSSEEPHDEDKHICLVPGCERNAPHKQTREDWCSICYCETLGGGAPVVRLDSCSHVFHLECVRSKIRAKWPGPRISFGFLGCANCKAEMDAPILRPLLDGVATFRTALRKLMMERLMHEGLDKHAEITCPDSPFYRNPELFAEHTFAFYPCFKCGSAFFGGHVRCEDAAGGGGGGGVNDDGENNNRDGDGGFNPEQLLCAKCTPDGSKRVCRIHGSAFVIFKCKFCCSIAAFFCWGNTHFCASCHKIQERGTFLNKLPITDLPVCPGKDKCPLGVEHPPNGVAEFPLGCALCS